MSILHIESTHPIISIISTVVRIVHPIGAVGILQFGDGAIINSHIFPHGGMESPLLK